MKAMNSKFGKVSLLKNNPREIRDNQFTALAESVERDPEFMDVRKIVVWEVPANLQEYAGDEAKCPFIGQEGNLVIIGGNQRAKVLQMQGQKTIPDEWVIEAKDKDGNWWSVDRAMRFVLVDNSQEGNSGSNDFEKLAEFFDEATLRLSGVDFSEFVTSEEQKVKETLGDIEKEGGPEDELEEGDHGEKNEDLQKFIAEREKTRQDLKYIDETGFHLLAIFDSQEAKAEFVAKSGLCGKGGKVAGNGSNYVDMVFESSIQKQEFAEKAGLLCEDDEGDPRLMYGMFCDGRYIAEKMGIQLAASGFHFRERKIDTRLAAMAREEAPQKTPAEIEEDIYKRLKKEREALNMPEDTTSRGKRGKVKGKKWERPGDEERGFYVDEIGDDEEGEEAPPND